MNVHMEYAHVCMKRLTPKLYTDSFTLQEMAKKDCDYKSGNAVPVVDESFSTFAANDKFSGRDKHFWLIKRVELPALFQNLADNEELYLKGVLSDDGWAACNPQLMFYIDGQLRQSGDTNHREVKLDKTKTAFDLAVYVYSGMPQPNREGNVSTPEFTLRLELVKKDALAEKVYYDIKVLYECAEITQENSMEFFQIMDGLRRICEPLDFRFDVEGAYRESLRAASDAADAFFADTCKKGKPQVTCIGHTHIDIAWLWTIRQSREKAQRSFSTVLALMERFPDYKFMSSQPVLYEMVKEEDPEEYARIQKAVKDGRWEAEGAMWVEADCNLVSGESLVRQLLVGKTFFKDELGVDSKILWLPDVFGYSAALPQILKKSGVDTFVTSKISWNDTNMLPYDVFYWQGIDGTEIFSTFLTAQDKQKNGEINRYTTYNASGSPAQVAGAWARMQQKDITDEAIITYGYGDGGGGSTPQDVEQIARMQNGIPGIPTAVFDTVTNYVKRLKKNANGKKVPKWVGELYLEHHRGTYTSQANNKKYNRKCEFAYTNMETLAVLAEQNLGVAYPTEELQKAWKTILTYQFHDIIPGSSIAEVYEDTNAVYPVLLQSAEDFMQNALKRLKKRLDGDGGYLVYNPNSFTGNGYVRLGEEYYQVCDIPSKGYKVTALLQPKNCVRVEGRCMENEYYRVEFADNYEIKRIYSKKYDRELLKDGQNGNVLTAYNDFPSHFDAWDIHRHYTHKSWTVDGVESVETVRQGARAGIRIRRKFDESVIVQTVFLYENGERIDIENDIDWKASHVLLKTAFPLNVNTSKATFDIQFGNIERNTHKNTSWDEAKFEVCAHKYVDVCDGGFGVAILNDCKYGHSVNGSDLSLTLLKSPSYPDKYCDRGRHTFTYSLYAHELERGNIGVIRQAYDLNNPMLVQAAEKGDGTLPSKFSLVAVDAPNVFVEALKKAEDNNGYILRMYEGGNMQAKARISFGLPVKKAYVTDLMENTLTEIPVENNACELPFKGFEIQTLRIIV